MINIIHYKKILLRLLVVFFSISYYNSGLYANYQDDVVGINNKLIYIYSQIDSRSFGKQTDFYKIFKQILATEKIKTTDTDKLELLTYIEQSVDNKYKTYKNINEQNLKNLPNFSEEGFQKHSTLILRFTRNGNHDVLIKKYEDKIMTNASVFLFKTGKDLTVNDIQIITKKIKALNTDIDIFIDQEGGWINRYVDYKNQASVDKNFSNSIIDKKIKTLFPSYSGYYPSLEKIGKYYDTLPSDTDKIYFLNKVALIRLQGLKDNGINTYGLVLDLNRGNPVISNYSRSFSKHKEKYKKLVDAFTIASKKTGVKLYFKHFPGHGEGNIDSHIGILNLQGKEEYVRENIELFNYALNKNTRSGLMIGHMYLPESTKQYFKDTIDKANFLLTDDLGMQGYKKATGKTKAGLFFTTDQIIHYTNLVTVDSLAISGIK